MRIRNDFKHLINRAAFMNSIALKEVVATTQPQQKISVQEVEKLFDLPFSDLLFQAQTVHRQHFNPNEVQLSTLLSIKTGGCPEDCGYCPQAARYHTQVDNEALLPLDEVLEAA